MIGYVNIIYMESIFLIKIKILQNKYKKNFNGEQAVTKCVLNMDGIMSQLVFLILFFAGIKCLSSLENIV